MDEYRIKSNVETTGAQLRELYLKDPDHHNLKSIQNVKLLFNYLLFLSSDRKEDMEIVDYCVNFLKEDLKIDEEKKKQYFDKLMMEVDAKELSKLAASEPDHAEFNNSNTLDRLFMGRLKRLNNKSTDSDNRILLFALNKTIDLERKEYWNTMKRTARKLTAAAAAIVFVLMTTEMVGRATGGSIVSFVVDSVQQRLAIYFDTDELYEHSAAVDREPLRWLPQGYHLERTNGNRYYVSKNTEYQYLFGENEINYKIIEIEKKDSGAFSEINDRAKYIKLNEKTYYIVKNVNRNKIIWYEGITLYYLEGNVPLQLLKEIINNNFGGD